MGNTNTKNNSFDQSKNYSESLNKLYQECLKHRQDNHDRFYRDNEDYPAILAAENYPGIKSFGPNCEEELEKILKKVRGN